MSDEVIEIELPLFVCRPVDEERFLKETGFQLPLPPIYPNSVTRTCDGQDCDREIWVGPRVAEKHKEHPDAPVLCFLCGVRYQRAAEAFTGNKAEVRNLGGTHGQGAN